MSKQPLYEAGLEAIHCLQRAVQKATANPDTARIQELHFQADLILISGNTGHSIPDIEVEAQRISLLGR